MKLRQKFSEEELTRIKHAVREAESKISGEIVPVIIDRSGTYPVANYKSSIIFSLLGFATMIFMDRYVIDASHTLYYDPMFIFLVVLVSGVLGYFIPETSAVAKRMFLNQAVMDECTKEKAETAFLEEEVFNTRHRTGIMLFVSFFEHEVIVLADRGISNVVDQKEWDNLVKELVNFIKNKKIVEGIEWGVKRCGDILLEKGFIKTDDDINELKDDLRIN